MMGRMSRCTPSRETSGPWPDSRPATLSISSIKMMPICSARSTATRVTWSMSSSLFSSSWIKYSKASATLILRFFFCWPNIPESMSLILTSISSTPWLEMISNEGMVRSRTSRSTMRWSSLPSRSCRRSFSRVRCVCSRCAAISASGVPGAGGGAGGSRRSSTRSSAACSARSATSSSFSSRIMSMDVSTRSRTIDSTSRPTYPTSVYFEASTLTNGQPARRARRLAISVFPTPVGPIMRMFFGKTSSAISGGSFWRRTRLRNATATARLAAACPTMYLSSSRTISRGVMSSRVGRSSSPSTGGAPLPPGAKINSFSDLVGMSCSIPLLLENSLPYFHVRPLELFHGKVRVRKNADLAGNAHGFHGQIFGAEPRMLQKSARRSQSVRSAGADGHQAVIRLDDVPVARKNEGPFGVGHDEQCFEVPQRAVFAPFLGQLHGRLLQIARELLKFPFEAFKKCNRVGGRTGEAGDDFVIEEAPRFACGVLHDVIAHGHLAVSDEHNLIVPAHAQHCSAVHLRASVAVPHPAIIPPRESERQNPVRVKAYFGG